MIDAPIDMKDSTLHQTEIHAQDFSSQLSSPLADTHHGTAIATLLVDQSQVSLLPGMPLYAANIFRQDAAGTPVATAIGFVQALDWLEQQGATIVNVSLAGPPNDLMERAVGQAVSHGMEIVAAVGNDHLVNVKRYPAAYPGVIGVTAVDDHDHLLEQANQGDFVSFAAPGVDIWIPDGQKGSQGTAAGDYYTGTSFAAPFVTATLALAHQDIQRLRSTALDLGTPGYDPVYGWELIQTGPACMTTIGQKPQP